MEAKEHTIITEENQTAFRSWLKEEEKAQATIEKYERDLRAFSLWLCGAEVTKEAAVDYKHYLLHDCGRAATGVNAALAALNAFFRFIELNIKLKPLKVQRQTFRGKETELTKDEYKRLLAAAGAKGNERLNLAMQTICSTGIRVSELRFITVEAAHAGEVCINNKGKARTIFVPKDLKPILIRYANANGTRTGCIFITKTGKPLNRSNIWFGMKRLCEAAAVEPGKVFPHNLRALFARLFYEMDKDVIRLADILGHSDVDTTRIYLKESGENHRRRMDDLNLVVT